MRNGTFSGDPGCYARARVVRPSHPAGFGCGVLTVSRSARQLGVAGNALQLHSVTFGSAVIKDLNLLDAALREALYNVQSFVRVAREHTE